MCSHICAPTYYIWFMRMIEVTLLSSIVLYLFILNVVKYAGIVRNSGNSRTAPKMNSKIPLQTPRWYEWGFLRSMPALVWLGSPRGCPLWGLTSHSNLRLSPNGWQNAGKIQERGLQPRCVLHAVAVCVSAVKDANNWTLSSLIIIIITVLILNYGWLSL